MSKSTKALILGVIIGIVVINLYARHNATKEG